MALNVRPARKAGSRLLATRAEAELLEHASRRGVVVKPPGSELFRVQHLEGESDNSSSCFGGVAFAPIRLAEPIAELPAARGMHAAHADIGGVRLAQNREGEIFAGRPAVRRLDDEGAAVILRIRIRYARQILRHVEIVEQRNETADVGSPRRARQKVIRYR